MKITALQSLPTELLTCILRSVFTETTGWRDRLWHIATDNRTSPVNHALAATSPVLHDVIAAYFYSTFTFHFASSAEGSHSSSSSAPYAAHDFEAWILSIEPRHRRLIRRLHLEMHASELLMLFAPPEAAALLGMPKDRHVWTRVLCLLKDLNLNDLRISILGRSCPQPCRAGERTSTGFHAAPPQADGSIPVHFEADYRWIVKAVKESMDHLSHWALSFEANGRVVSRKEVQRIQASSWAMLHSSTQGYHHCDALTYESAPERSWASVGERREVYNVPVVFTAVLDRAVEDRGWDKSTNPEIEADCMPFALLAA